MTFGISLKNSRVSNNSNFSAPDSLLVIRKMAMESNRFLRTISHCDNLLLKILTATFFNNNNIVSS